MWPHNCWIEGKNHYFLAVLLLMQPSTWLAFVTANPHSTCHPPESKVLSWKPVFQPACTAARDYSITGTGFHISLHWAPKGSSCQAISPGPTEWWLPASISSNLVSPKYTCWDHAPAHQPDNEKTPNSTGPKIEPGRMPLAICYQLDFASLTTTLWAWQPSQCPTHPAGHLSGPSLTNLYRRLPEQTTSRVAVLQTFILLKVISSIILDF